MVKFIIIKTLKSHLIKITKQWMKKGQFTVELAPFTLIGVRGFRMSKNLVGTNLWGGHNLSQPQWPKIVGTSPHVPKKIRRTYTSLSGYLKLDLSRPITSEVSWERRKKLSSPPKNVLVNLNLKTNVIQVVEFQVKMFRFFSTITLWGEQDSWIRDWSITKWYLLLQNFFD